MERNALRRDGENPKTLQGKKLQKVGPWFKEDQLEQRQKNKRIYIKNLKVAHKIIYFLVLLSLVIILIVQIIGCIQLYNIYPTYIETNLVPQNKAAFPSMTICSAKNGYKQDVLQVT